MHKIPVSVLISAILFLTFSVSAGFIDHHDRLIAFVQGDAQKQFVSGMNNVFSGKEAGRFGWGKSAIQISLVFGAGMVAAGIVAAIVYLFKKYRRREKDWSDSGDTFLQNANKCGLTASERDKLYRMVSHQNVMLPHTIFQSLSLFEQCYDTEINQLLRTNPGNTADSADDEIMLAIRQKIGYQHIPLEYPLLSTRNVTIGQKGSLFGKDGTKPMFQHVSVIDNNSFYFTIQYDVEKEDIYHVQPGNLVRFVFARQGDGLYGVQVKVLSCKEAGILELSHTLEVRRNQLRQYVRMETNLPVKLRLVSTKDQEKSEVQRGQLINARMSDISGGGLSFVCDQALRLGDVISVSFDLPGASFSGISGKIVHLTLRDVKGAQTIKHHVQFGEIEPRKRETIIKYVFEKERQLSQWR